MKGRRQRAPKHSVDEVANHGEFVKRRPEQPRPQSAANGREQDDQTGMQRLTRKEAAVECLILDHNMPGLDGLDFMSELRQRGSNVPTIMITGTRSPRIERLALELGIKRVLEKPTSAQVLLDAIYEALGIGR